jgi:chemotaxis protein methyltransferase CheR
MAIPLTNGQDQVKLQSTDNAELELLLEAILKRYGYDFRDYSKPTIQRRVEQFVDSSHAESIADLIKPVLYDREFAFSLIKRFSINVSEMFRDPFVYQALLKHVIPLLRTYPSFKIWHAGCAEGQEVYSFAILLKEAGLLERATIFATDINDEALDTAKNGIYPIRDIQTICKNYQQAGGMTTFTNYCHAAYDAVTMNNDLKQHITFANHNLVQDASFGEMHLIFCRNVLIYFNHDLKERVLKLLVNSLINGGFICLGGKEEIMQSDSSMDFERIDSKCRIFRKKANSLAGAVYRQQQ